MREHLDFVYPCRKKLIETMRKGDMKMKKVKRVFIVLILVIMSTSCQSEKDEETMTAERKVSEYQDVYDISDVNMKLVTTGINLETEIIDIVIENRTDNIVETGSSYELSVLDGEKWYIATLKPLEDNTDYGTPDIGYNIESNEEMEFKIFISIYEMEVGQYRIIKIVDGKPIEVKFQIFQ